ncbi:MAG: hypothetical protein HYX41_07810 [Bdellovibrio sp.]|nr:hypothetical protein [Bdellovibrio sp.]
MEGNNRKLNLIQVVEVQNLSEDPVSVDLPSQLKGKLWQRSLWMDPQYSSYSKLFCADLPQEIETIETYSSDFFLLPLVEELSVQWVDLIQKETNPLFMLTRESKLYGVYATPKPLYEKDFKSLLKVRSPKEYSKSNPIQMVTVDTQCNFKCDSLNNTDTFRKQCKRLPTGSEDLTKCDIRVNSCVKCITLLPEFHKQDSCNECFNHEYYDAPAVSKYGGHLVCSSGWRKESLKTKQGKRGTEMGNILFEVPSVATLMNVHYANLPKVDDPEGRAICLLRSNQIE